MVKNMALCGLGKSAPLPVLSTLKTFRDEYVEHIVDKKCRAKTCQALRQYKINPEFCKGCASVPETVRWEPSQARSRNVTILTRISVSSAVPARTTVRLMQFM